MDSIPITTETDSQSGNNKQICWTGTLRDKTPIFIHYQLVDNLIIGELTFLNKKDKLPVKLIYISPQINRAVKNKSYFYNCYGKEEKFYIENQG